MRDLVNVDVALALATRQIAPAIMPNGWTVVSDVPDSLEAITEYFERTGTVAVTDYFGNDTLFADAATYQAFNAWHDFRHITHQAAFDSPGELVVNKAMMEDLFNWWTNSRIPITSAAYQRAAAVLNMHNVGRLDYWAAYGEAPPNPREFAMGFLTARGLIRVPTHCHQDHIAIELYEDQYPREAREEAQIRMYAWQQRR